MAKPPAQPHASTDDNPAQGEPAPPVDAPEPSGKEPAKRPPWYDLFELDEDSAKDEQISEIISRELATVAGVDELAVTYNLVFFLDSVAIGRYDADRIYSAVSGMDRKKPILLTLRSPGGDIASAYFVSKICRENTQAHFAVAVPREAKSAATLLCCGADRIHMGGLSELGPIDPQFGGIPALALKHSVEHMAELVARFPAAADMLTNYLKQTLKIEALGYYERVAASAVQYAVRLLNSRSLEKTQPLEPTAIAERLVYAYKDHGFVIDAREATEIFGPEVVKTNTKEYDLANTIYSQLGFLAYVVQRRFNRHLAFIGDLTKGPVVTSRPSD